MDIVKSFRQKKNGYSSDKTNTHFFYNPVFNIQLVDREELRTNDEPDTQHALIFIVVEQILTISIVIL